MALFGYTKWGGGNRWVEPLKEWEGLGRWSFWERWRLLMEEGVVEEGGKLREVGLVEVGRDR